MSNPALTRALISDLRQQLVELADNIGPYGELPGPTGRLPKRFDGATGPVWEIPGNGTQRLGVLCTDDEPGVFVEGAAFSFGGDWHALNPAEARAFGMALLAAADWSDRKHNPQAAS